MAFTETRRESLETCNSMNGGIVKTGHGQAREAPADERVGNR